MNAFEIVSSCLKLLSSQAVPGVETLHLDELAEDYITSQGGRPYNKGYNPAWSDGPYKFSTCISINNEIGHGLPSHRKLTSGDLVSFDVSVDKDGEVADAALTVGVGELSHEDEKLLRLAKRALYAGISVLHDGVTILDISRAIERTVNMAGYVVNHTFVGHGIGKEMHEPPEIPHFVGVMNTPGSVLKYYTKLREGQRICLEPMVTFKDEYGIQDPNGWTWRTKNNAKSAFFEHTLEITKDGATILTNHINQ